MTDHYFDADPAAPDHRREISARIWGRDYEFTTASGVFARDGLDKATAILLRESVPPVGARRLLDLGCGWGAIAVPLAVEATTAVVDAVDTNERARTLTEVNARRAGVDARVRVASPDSAPADVTYDEIWSNPPIRIGKPALHELLLTWLPRLAADGVARMVVGKNLGADSLHRWLDGQGWPTERVASAKGFRVLSTRRG